LSHGKRIQTANVCHRNTAFRNRHRDCEPGFLDHRAGLHGDRVVTAFKALKRGQRFMEMENNALMFLRQHRYWILALMIAASLVNAFYRFTGH
jgi:hypothetical protein